MSPKKIPCKGVETGAFHEQKTKSNNKPADNQI